MTRLMVVEDQDIVRQGLIMMLECDDRLSVVAEAGDGRQAMEQLERTAVDLILMDIRMPIMTGLEATREIKQRWPHVKIIMLTTFNDDDYALEALKEGASGFLLKTSDRHKLIQSVHAVLNGGMCIHEDVAARVVPLLLNQSQPSAQPVDLTPRELVIVGLVGQGKTNKEIADTLFLSIGTVKNHLTSILMKLDLRDRTQLAIFSVKNGLDRIGNTQ